MRLFLFIALSAFADVALAKDGYTLHDLVGTKIYSASKKEEDLYRSPSANFVITADDIARIGARHVADALRIVPGLQVAKISSNKWMVASRGFGEQFSNKLLVLVDGRPIYTTLFSGVLWFQQDIPIIDIKQIEVIRGPGATLWGSNAVNGVINIITKSADESVGTRVHNTIGLTDKGRKGITIEAQDARKIEELGFFRATLKGRKEPSYTPVKNDINYQDGWNDESLNFRFDSKQNAEKSLKITGSIFNSNSDQTYKYPALVSPFYTRSQGSEVSKGAYINGDYTKEFGDHSTLTTNSYIDYTDWYYAGYNPKFITGSVGTQYNFFMLENWESIIGSSYKITSDQVEDSDFLITNPSSKTAQFVDAFAQTKIPLIGKELHAVLGTKVESNSYNEFNVSPNAKMAWEPDPLVMTWVSWSKASRIPSRNTFGLTTYSSASASGYTALIPSTKFKSEDVNAYEGGIRFNPYEGVHIDTSVFYNSYKNLRTFLPGPAMAAPIATPLYISNSGYAHNKGVEIAGSYQTSPSLQLTASYSRYNLNFKADPGLVDPVYLNSGGKWAKDVIMGGIYYAPSDDIQINMTEYYYGEQPAIKIPAYYKLDGNVSWRLSRGVEAVGGIDNITDNLHPEYSAQLFGEPTEVPRIYYLTLKFDL